MLTTGYISSQCESFIARILSGTVSSLLPGPRNTDFAALTDGGMGRTRGINPFDRRVLIGVSFRRRHPSKEYHRVGISRKNQPKVGGNLARREEKLRT